MLSTLTMIARQVETYHKGTFCNKLILVSCQATATLLFMFCAIITSQQYFGEPIKCIQDVNSDSSSIPEKVMNNFCFVSSTYSSVGAPPNPDVNNDRSRKHSYYPWVPLVIFLQGLSFMMPQLFWTISENSYLEKCLRDSRTLLRQDILYPLAKYISKRINYFGEWSTSYLMSEIVYSANIIGNFILIDTFLGRKFMDYGFQAIYNGFYGDNIFPKMTKCSFYKYGPSGSIEYRDALCLMTLNIINEKLYLFLWFWFILLMFLAGFIIIKRALYFVILVNRYKYSSLTKRFIATDISLSGFTMLNNRLSFSDWILLENIKPQMYSKSYSKLLENIVEEMTEPHDLINIGVIEENINIFKQHSYDNESIN